MPTTNASAATATSSAANLRSEADFLSMEAQSNEPEAQPSRGPDRRTRLIGQTICAITLRAPWAWPLLRGPVTRFFDRLAPTWDERTGAGSPEHLATLARAVLAIDSEPERILDIGAGTGAGTLFLAREYPRARIRGIDISPAMVERAKAKVGLDPEGRVAFRQADASRLPYDERSFDLVAQTNVPVFLPEITRVLRDGGHFIVASTDGPRTPFYTSHAALRRGLERRGFEIRADETAGRGSYLVARRPGSPQ